MDKAIVKFDCHVGDYEISFSSDWLPLKEAEDLCSSFDDWAEFIEKCFDPVVIYQSDKSKHRLGLFCSITHKDLE